MGKSYKPTLPESEAYVYGIQDYYVIEPCFEQQKRVVNARTTLFWAFCNMAAEETYNACMSKS